MDLRPVLPALVPLEPFPRTTKDGARECFEFPGNILQIDQIRSPMLDAIEAIGSLNIFGG